MGIQKDKLSVTVTSKIPELCTADMAYRAILIPIDKSAADLPVTVEREIIQLE